MNAPWKAGAPGGRDPYQAFICDDAALDGLRPVVVEMGWAPEKCHKGGLRNAVQALSISASPNILLVDLSESGDPLNDINALAEVCEPGTVVKWLITTARREAWRVGKRVRAGKTISPSFLFAALLWQQVEVRWKQLRAQGEHTIPALSSAADSVLDEQTEKLAIQRRFSSDMREIWFMQARFERINAKAIWRMIEQPRFRAAVDFLQLRAEAREVDSVQAQWWMDLANADHATRGEMIESYQAEHRGNRPAGAKRRRRRPRKRPATQTAGQPSQA